jgi:hypothetical protein
MVRNPRRHACICIEACSGGFWGILRQGIRRVSFGKHVLALGFDGIQLFQRELAYRVKPTRGCKAIISGKLSVGPRTSQSYRRRVCLPCWTEADDESGLGAEAMYRQRGNWVKDLALWQGSRPAHRETTSGSDSQLHLDHRHGLPWTPGHLGAVARQRDGQGAYPLQNIPRPSLTKHDIGRISASNVYGPAQPVQEIQLLLVSVAVS